MQVNRSAGVLDSGVGGGDVGLLAGLVVQQEQQAEDVNHTDGGQQTCCLLILSGPQGAADGEGAVQQIAEGGAGLQSTEVGEMLERAGQVVNQALDEIAALTGVARLPTQGQRRSDGGSRMLRVETIRNPRSLGGMITRPTRTMNTAGKTIPVMGTKIAGSQAAAKSPVMSRPKLRSYRIDHRSDGLFQAATAT